MRAPSRFAIEAETTCFWVAHKHLCAKNAALNHATSLESRAYEIEVIADSPMNSVSILEASQISLVCMSVCTC